MSVTQWGDEIEGIEDINIKDSGRRNAQPIRLTEARGPANQGCPPGQPYASLPAKHASGGAGAEVQYFGCSDDLGGIS